mmetsp:Transcript_49128/g.146753  ORF Transcript_49128/g.146753 Transcript_49128/m.146753 type:complete len:303 (+) Transcript_49128:289-1197(+)
MLVAGLLHKLHPPAAADPGRRRGGGRGAPAHRHLHEGPGIAIRGPVAKGATLLHAVRLDEEAQRGHRHAKVKAARRSPARRLINTGASVRSPDAHPSSRQHEHQRAAGRDQRPLVLARGPGFQAGLRIAAADAELGCLPGWRRHATQGGRPRALGRLLLLEALRLGRELRQHCEGELNTLPVQSEGEPGAVEPHQYEAHGDLLQREGAQRLSRGFERVAAAISRPEAFPHDAHAGHDAEQEQLGDEGCNDEDAEVGADGCAEVLRLRQEEGRPEGLRQLAHLPAADRHNHRGGEGRGLQGDH